MRFTSNGPSIPDALLQARDEGRVVFFCGAGVSRARAGLPDFFGLAEFVIRELGAQPDSAACKILRKAKELGEELDVTGLISADRVFSFLEREFTANDIQSAVAKCLAPATEVDRSAHELLLRLARTPDGKTQIVTTNFDRLFEGEVNIQAQCFSRLACRICRDTTNWTELSTFMAALTRDPLVRPAAVSYCPVPTLATRTFRRAGRRIFFVTLSAAISSYSLDTLLTTHPSTTYWRGCDEAPTR